jgi:hypothetical protein
MPEGKEVLMRENPLMQLLTKIVQEDVPFYYKGKYWNLSSPDLPIGAGVKFVREQLTALIEVAKASSAAGSAASTSEEAE